MGMPVASTPLGITYLDPDGNSWYLSDLTMANGLICSAIAGVEGLATMTQTIPLLDGTAIPNLYIPQPGSITLAVFVGWPDPSDESSYYQLLDNVVRAFLTRRNELPVPGYLQVQRPDGSVRQIAVYTTSGLNTPEVSINGTLYTLTLQTPDPYWSDLVQQTLVFASGASSGILPVLPVTLSGTVLGSNIVNNGGNALAWPVWTITGPGTPTIKNVTTGRQWSLSTSIPAGNVVQVATKPGTQYATNLTTSTNIWNQLTYSSPRDLWPLVGGANQVSVTMAGSTAASSVKMVWTNRWSRA